MRAFFTASGIQVMVLIGFFVLTGKSQWLTDKYRDLILFASVYLIGTLVGGITYFFRPLTTNIQMSNSLNDSEKSTILYFEDERITTSENARTINLTIEIERRGSIWWRCMKSVLHYFEVSICVTTTPAELYLQARDELLLPEIQLNNQRGFNIYIDSFYLQLSRRNQSFKVSRGYEYILNDHPEFPLPPDSTFTIEPIFVFKEKNENRKILNFLFKKIGKLLLKLVTETHEVKVFRR